MRVFKTTLEVRKFLSGEESIGFVPTMGALHEGHLSLIERAQTENDLTVCSIFVNPSQFNDPNDFKKYPRHECRDLEMLESMRCDLVFMPGVDEVFPKPDEVKYDLSPIADVLEGEKRPGHFNGVASVVKRLFEIVEPDRAYFGLKDYQQYLLIKNLSERYGLGVKVIGCPTIREASGLARSSRNERLGVEDALPAAQLYESLRLIADKSRGHTSAELENMGRAHLAQYPRIEVEYLKVVDPDTLLVPMKDDGTSSRRALIAARIGEVRLIDNMEI